MMPSILFRSAEDGERMRRAYVSFLAEVPGTVRERYVDTRWGQTRVLVTGPADGAPLVVLHGAMATASHVLPELGPLLITAGFTPWTS